MSKFKRFKEVKSPFIIAEMSGNHNQSLERALTIIEAAAKSGVHGVKLQTYTPDTMTLNINEREFMITEENNLWKGTSLYQLYQRAHTPWEWHEPIFKRCRELGLVAFSTPFDLTAVEFLESLDVPCYKIASFENTDLPLLRRVAQTGKPILASTGMATIADLDELVRTVRENGCPELILLKCTSSYPATPEGSNLRTIPHMRDLFHCEVGISDHTLGCGTAVAAVALGATVIEKHFTLSRAEGGVDAAFSMEPIEMARLVEDTKQAWESMGEIHYGVEVQEKKSLQYRRSLYIVEDMVAGDQITDKNMRAIRPGFGLSPKFYDLVLGKTIKKNVERGTALKWDLI